MAMKIKKGRKRVPDTETVTADLEALGRYVYGENWRVIMAVQTELDILIDLAAAKQLTPVAPLRQRSWSEETENKVKRRCETMLMEFFSDKTKLDDSSDIDKAPLRKLIVRPLLSAYRGKNFF